MSEMVERVADAMGAAIVKQEGVGNLVGGYDEGNGDIAVEAVIDLRAVARAVLAAMREPTHEMQYAGEFDIVMEEENVTVSSFDAAKIWQQMIDAALGETP